MTWAPNTADGLSPAPLLGALLSARPLTRGQGEGLGRMPPSGLCVQVDAGPEACYSYRGPSRGPQAAPKPLP